MTLHQTAPGSVSTPRRRRARRRFLALGAAGVLAATVLLGSAAFRSGASSPAGSSQAAAVAPATGATAGGAGPAGTGSSGPAAAPADAALGPTDPSTAVEVQLVLRQPAAAAITPFLASLQDPSSPQYHHYLSVADYGKRFGLDDAAIARVVAWLTAGGFSVDPVEPQRTQVRGHGTVAAAQALLGVTIRDHRLADGVTYHAPDAAPRIPAAVRDSVTAIAGLNDRPVYQPAFRPPAPADVRSGGMLPADLRLAYDIQPLTDAGMDGTGQTVAIVSFDSFLDSDLAAWDQLTGTQGGGQVLHVPVPTGATVTPGSGSDEVNLDIQTIRSIAPKATILDFEMASHGGSFADIMGAILADGRADIVNISWSHCEADISPDARAAADAQFQAAFAAGISIYVASGDRGAYDCNMANFEGDLTVSVGYPEDLPYVIGAGGTTLSVRQDGTYYGETAWSDPLDASGTGGGMSAAYPRPDWQQAAGIDPSRAGRLVPDVAGPADADTGILLTYTPSGATKRVTAEGGGTSQAAPFWAGITALIRQLADQQGVLPTVNGQKRIGALGPTLYTLAANQGTTPLFHDVTLGSNLLDPAGAGWDPATGLGSPIVSSLAQAIVNSYAGGTP